MSFPHTTIEPGDPAYPHGLRDLGQPPQRLEVRGRLPRHERAVAIVGARAAKTADADAAHELARALVERGVLVVSGGALGIDAAAHRGALAADRDAADSDAADARGGTVAVMGCGLDVIYPEQHGELFHQICTHGGGLLSQYKADAPPRSWHFARRNETMAAMCDAVVVIGAGAHSGALHTARAARSLNRVLGAMPGSPGCEVLIASGAAVIHGIEDLERAMSGSPRRPDIELPAPDTVSYRVLDCLDPRHAKNIDAIIQGTGLNVHEVQRALTSLELDGLVIPAAGRSYRCSQLAGQLTATRGL